MKKLQLVCLAGLCIASSGYAAVDGTYMTGQLGVSDTAFNGAGPYIHLALGDQLNRYFAIEAGATAIPTTSGDDSWVGGGVAKLYSLDGDVKGMLPLGKRVDLYAKLGPSVAYFKENRDDDNGNQVSVMGNAAVGVSFDVTEHWTTDLSVGSMAGDNTVLITAQLGLGYHFA